MRAKNHDSPSQDSQGFDSRSHDSQGYDTPLRRTQLGSLVDHAAKGEENAGMRPTAVRNVCLVCVVVLIGVGAFAHFQGARLQTIFGLSLIFVGIVSGWAQLSFIMNPLYTHSVRQRIVIIVFSILSILIAVGGIVVLFVAFTSFEAIWIGLIAGVSMLVAIAIIVAPWWLTVLSDLGSERAKAAREELRSDIASQLHDSVLQTLTLIQLNATDSKKVAALARAQERDLRDWLYGDLSSPVVDTANIGATNIAGVASAPVVAGLGSDSPTVSRTLVQTLKRVVAPIEDSSGVAIEFVNVSDIILSDRLMPMVDAAREALLNASRHGKPPVSVYCEVHETWQHLVEIFVRDHGDGFDMNHLPKGHFGVSESIVGRMNRSGGSAVITTRNGWGTEVKLSFALGSRGSAAVDGSSVTQSDNPVKMS